MQVPGARGAGDHLFYFSVGLNNTVNEQTIFELSKKIWRQCTLTVGTCCRGGFRRAFLSEGHGTAKRESAVGVPPNPALQYVLCYGLGFIHFVLLSVSIDSYPYLKAVISITHLLAKVRFV